MDQVLINQLQFYTPPQLIKQILQKDRVCYEVARYIIDREFRHKPQKWKTIAFADYEDFFQAAISGFNPYKEVSQAKDKGLLQAVASYNPYKKQEEVEGELLLATINNVEQAVCPHCRDRGDQVSLWPHSAGNEAVDQAHGPEPVFHKGNKYCGREIEPCDQIEEWLEKGLIRASGKRFMCNYKSRLASLKSYIISQIRFLIQDVRSAEYHPSRNLRKHPFFPCPKCGTLNPDFNTSTTNKTEELECTQCNDVFALSIFKGKNNASGVVWQARGVTSEISFSDHSSETDGRSSYEEIISNYSLSSTIDDPAVHHNIIEQEKTELYDELITRIRELSASALSKRQYERLMNDPEINKVDGIPETQNFQIFYEYFFIDDQKQKDEHKGKAKDRGDESSTYRELAFKYLSKEQHYTQCTDCSRKMYEPTESAKFKRSGTRQECDACESTNVVYHGPKCGRPNGKNPNCPRHGAGGLQHDVEVVMYIFQTIEPKIRRLEELVKSDNQAQEISERIQDLLIAKDEMDAHQDMVKLLNY